MTRRQLRIRLALAITALIVILALGVLLRFGDMPLISAHDQSEGYDLVKDLSPLILGIVAVLLTSWYQQPMAHLDALRTLFSRMIDAKTAMHLCIASPTQTDDAYSAAYREISRTIDEVRTVYRNVGEDARSRVTQA